MVSGNISSVNDSSCSVDFCNNFTLLYSFLPWTDVSFVVLMIRYRLYLF